MKAFTLWLPVFSLEFDEVFNTTLIRDSNNTYCGLFSMKGRLYIGIGEFATKAYIIKRHGD